MARRRVSGVDIVLSCDGLVMRLKFTGDKYSSINILKHENNLTM
jgi:hypothetical protein